ncbi:MAG: DUF5689 domain-containing protein [Paludibacteraceae bacterium]
MQRKLFLTIPTLLAALTAVVFTACEPRALTEDDVFPIKTIEDVRANILQPGDSIYHLDDFVATFATKEEGNFLSDSTPYRMRATAGDGIYLFSIDTIPTDTIGIYIRGRISTDDYGGNFYKSLVIQEIVDGKQQNLRLSVDMGSLGGLYQIGQEILVRCNGLALGRYANQPQLCVPSYNNNIYATNATQKVGWAPGRIPNELFRKATTMIGVPDKSKLQYDTIKISDFFDLAKTYDLTHLEVARKMDGRLVVLKDVYFTGQYEDNGAFKDCTTGDPEKDGNANVFAPTTGNVGYPQGRVITDGTNKTLVSTSEYAKFAYYYLPAAEYKGTVTGILGFYADNASSASRYGLDGYEWSITLRNISTAVDGINDLCLYKPAEDGKQEEWVPVEYTPEAATSAQ